MNSNRYGYRPPFLNIQDRLHLTDLWNFIIILTDYQTKKRIELHVRSDFFRLIHDKKGLYIRKTQDLKYGVPTFSENN